ncbi:uncharacterized protein si:ch211-102c2.4 [Triplophysa dalaica]|uniref:uncharacterized protein si:ch211-102c2.4 n=1 Tax=Triplophysa dalaica TaxID=1582913 RepID=UPI0024DF5400|nr:uncharacterized protein si:ch211-102c2.4 [Triplophysa dalaica]
MMILLTTILLMMITGHSTSEYVQSLRCNFEHKNNVSDRIWCRRDDQNENCCTGFSFKPGVKTLEDNKILVNEDEKSFVVSMLTLTHGEGVYWCGLMDKDKKSIIKLNQKHFYDPMDFIWSILRWIIFILLALMFISINIYINKKYGNEENTYEDIRMRVKE